MRFSTPFSKAATVCAAATLSLGLSVGTAYALPPGGASGNTPGTSSTVSPTVKSGGVISFNLSGFPQNTMVSVKIDDGDACPADAPQGACVVHQQKSDGNGNVSGSFVLPSDLENGQHTLRFLAAGSKKNSKGDSLGTQPFSNRSPVFTVTGGSDGGNKSGGGNSGGSSSNSGASNNNGGGSRSSGGNKSGGGGASNNNGGGGSSNNGGGASGDSGSSNNSGGGTSGGAADSGETEYVDADGNKITKEEYDRLNSENGGDSETEGDADTSNTEDGTTTNGEKKQKSSNGTTQKKATAKANASGVNKQSNSSDKAQAKNETTNTTVTYGSEFPWIGTIVLAAAAIAAAIIVIVRRKA